MPGVVVIGGGPAGLAAARELTRMGASLLFGLLWALDGPQTALEIFTIGLVGAIVAATLLIAAGRKEPDEHLAGGSAAA